MHRIIFCILLAFVAVFAQSEYSHTPFSSYLMLPLSPADEALGQAFPQFWTNPAAIPAESGIAVEAGYRYRWGDASDNFLSALCRMGNYSAFALLQLSSVSELEGRTRATSEPEYLFSANRANILLGGSFAIYRYVRVGIAGRHIHERLELQQFDANTFSGGVLANWRNFSAGLSATDYGGKDAFVAFLYPPPMVYRAQASYDGRYFSAGAAFTKPDLQDGYGSVAAKASPVNWLDVMASYTFMHDSRSFSCGTAFKWRGFSLCYAMALYGELGTNHFASMGYWVSFPRNDADDGDEQED